MRIWDIRALKVAYNIPAHKSSVSDVRFFRSADEAHLVQAESITNGVKPESMDIDASGDKEDKPKVQNIGRSGLYLASSGFDHTVKLWSADDWQMLSSLKTDEGKVMSVDVSSDGKTIASGSYSRSFHLFMDVDAF
jgi:U4/U6 small nuclear ribonucleoprotein PRP4